MNTTNLSTEINEAATLASRFINHTDRHVFLTGKAGTGKTTFLRSIIKQTHKKAVIAAPTGIAAINAGGVTLHSLFQLPFGAFVPERTNSNLVANQKINDPYSLIQNSHLRGNKRKLLQEIELLIIDEVSMLRADLLDAVDTVLRFVRGKNNVPFGGVQILFIGDLMQLPPVIKDEEWQVLGRYYKSQWFFDAQALQNHKPYYIELDKIYRQQDQQFIDLLNNLRNNNYTDADIELLNSFYKPGYRASASENIIYLTTHNYKAAEINKSELAKLSGKSYFFKAEIEGDFSEFNYPLDEVLELKLGAQVMFVKNDMNEEKRYFNGKIGKVTELEEDFITVAFDDGSAPVNVEKHNWENIKYNLNEATNEVDENVAGTFRHFPLRLAWAITIHKSQGLTFKKAIIDIGRAFAPGQVYVALSRLTSLSGLILTSPINYNSISEDAAVAKYAVTKQAEEILKEALENDSAAYLRNFILKGFDFTPIQRALQRHLESYTKDEQKSAKQKFASWGKTLKEDFEPNILTSNKFSSQLQNILAEKPIDLEKLLARIISAKNYFIPILKAVSKNILAQVETVKTEKKIKTYITELTELDSLIYKQQQLIAKAEALVNSAIHKTELNSNIAEIRNENKSREETWSKLSIKGEKRERSGRERRNGRERAERKPKKEKGQTQQESFILYKDGKSVSEIAQIRLLTESTIQGHLARYVASGDLDVFNFIEKEKLNKIIAVINEEVEAGFGSIKQKLGEDFSYGEIRFAEAFLKRKEEK